MIAIIDYKAGNLTSVSRALDKLGYENIITDDPNTILSAERIIFPGVGAAKATMDILKNHTSEPKDQTSGLSLADVLCKFYDTGKPMLGICIGIQILFEHSEEENTDCLGLLHGSVKKYPIDSGLKVPQIGWNEVVQIRPHKVFEDVPNPAHFYFVNAYYPVPDLPDVVIGKTEYGIEFCSAIANRNIIATQFHLEKSGRVGLKLLDNFLKWQVDTES